MTRHDTGRAAGAGLVARYLNRLGVGAPLTADAAGLRELHRAHLRAVPFENLDIHLGVPIELGDAAINKILGQHRGGFCYELNGSFAALLGALGFTVHLLEARVYGDDGKLGIRYDHMCLLVELDDARYLADVGFGAFLDEPIRLTPGLDQADRNGTFRVEERGDGSFDVLENGVRQYWFDLTPRALLDFGPGAEFNQSPESHFAKGTVCSIVTDRGRVTLSGLKVTETIDGARTVSEIRPASLRAFLDDRFGVRLDTAAATRLASSAIAAGRGTAGRSL